MSDTGNDLVGAFNLVGDALQGLAGLRHQLHALFHLAGGAGDLVLDLLGRGGGPLGQFAHFLRDDDAKTLAAFAARAAFHTGIQRQKVGLEGDLVDHADDLGDLRRRLLDAAHRADRLFDDRVALAGFAADGLNALGGFLGAIRRLAHGDRQFVERG